MLRSSADVNPARALKSRAIAKARSPALAASNRFASQPVTAWMASMVRVRPYGVNMQRPTQFWNVLHGIS